MKIASRKREKDGLGLLAEVNWEVTNDFVHEVGFRVVYGAKVVPYFNADCPFLSYVVK